MGLRRTLLDTYVTDGTERMAQLGTAVARHDYLAVQNVAHAMKSSSALLGVLTLADLLQRTENAARADTSKVAPLAALADEEYRRAAQVIGTLLDTPEQASAAAPPAGPR